MLAQLYLMKSDYAQVGDQPVKVVDITQETTVGIMTALQKEFEEVIATGEYKPEVLNNLQCKVLWVNEKDIGVGIYPYNVGAGDKKLCSINTLLNLIPAFKYTNGKLQPHGEY